MTAEDLLRLPDDGKRHELVQGELRTISPAGFRHGVVAMAIGGHLADHVRRNHLGVVCAAETGFVLTRNPDTVRAPDAAFVRQERSLDERGFFAGAPDL